MSFKVLQVIPKLGYGGAETGCYDVAHYISEKNCKSYIPNRDIGYRNKMPHRTQYISQYPISYILSQDIVYRI